MPRHGYANVVTAADEPVLTDAAAVDAFFARTRPTHVFLAGGKSGGIRANQKYPAELMLDNLLVECHVIASAHRHSVTKLLYLASSCTYPKLCPQPMRVEAILTGPFEPTNEAYSVAKLAGIKLCQAYRRQYGANFVSGVLADIFGADEEFDAEDAHVVPALIRKMHEAKERGLPSAEIWGTGRPQREFGFSDDLADACILVMREYNGAEPINIGTGQAISIREVAEFIRDVVGFRGELRFDPSRPDGMPMKLLDTAPLRALGWQPQTPLSEALALTYESFLKTTHAR